MRLWVPSQNGFTTDPPHLHSDIHESPSGVDFLLPSGMGTGFPLWSTRFTSPWTLYGPFFRISIVTSAILQLGGSEAIAQSPVKLRR